MDMQLEFIFFQLKNIHFPLKNVQYMLYFNKNYLFSLQIDKNNVYLRCGLTKGLLMDVFKSSMMKACCPYGCNHSFKCPECNFALSSQKAKKKNNLKKVFRKMAKAKLKANLLLEIK